MYPVDFCCPCGLLLLRLLTLLALGERGALLEKLGETQLRPTKNGGGRL